MLAIPAPWKLLAKLEIAQSEVKRLQSLEVPHRIRYSSPLRSHSADGPGPLMTPRIPTILAAAAAAACMGCGALSAPKAQFPVTITSTTVYALNGAAPSTPAGINLLTGTAVTVDASFSFNVALDIDSLGRVVVYPARRVADSLVATTPVGLEKIGVNFDDYNQATKSGYGIDSTLVVPVGTTVGFNVYSTVTCTAYSLGSSYYGKFVVDSIDPVQRALYVRLASDPNCGYVTLTSGLPTK
jgi:hypothetical protein